MPRKSCEQPRARFFIAWVKFWISSKARQGGRRRSSSREAFCVRPPRSGCWPMRSAAIFPFRLRRKPRCVAPRFMCWRSWGRRQLRSAKPGSCVMINVSRRSTASVVNSRSRWKNCYQADRRTDSEEAEEEECGSKIFLYLFLCDLIPYHHPATSFTLSISPGRQRIVSAMGRQHTVQSSINDCSDCEVSTCSGNDSPQCGHTISVSITNSILSSPTQNRPLLVDQGHFRPSNYRHSR